MGNSRDQDWFSECVSSLKAIPCPRCGGEIARVCTLTVMSLQYEEIMCRCGFSGPLAWSNPNLPQEGRRGAAQKILHRKLGTSTR